ncbi:MAG: hypothetical protein MJ078_07950, partial [Clostridia bacterium]|nr:hypothetical protein [Clostridia bacterium]
SSDTEKTHRPPALCVPEHSPPESSLPRPKGSPGSVRNHFSEEAGKKAALSEVPFLPVQAFYCLSKSLYFLRFQGHPTPFYRIIPAFYLQEEKVSEKKYFALTSQPKIAILKVIP